MKMTNEAKVNTLETTFGGFTMTVQPKSGGKHGNTKIEWHAKVAQFKIWDKGELVWRDKNFIGVGYTPSIAINSLWDTITSQAKVFRINGTDDEYCHLFNKDTGQAVMIDSSHPEFPKEPADALLAGMVWPPNGWQWVKQHPSNSQKAVNKHGDYLYVGGSHIKVKALKMFVGEIDVYIDNDVELPPNLAAIQEELRTQGMWKQTPDMLAKIEAEKAAAKKAAESLAETYAKDQALWHAANPGKPGQSPEEQLQQKITNQMQKWGSGKH